MCVWIYYFMVYVVYLFCILVLYLIYMSTRWCAGCRGGMIKMWSSESCQLIGELKAHSSPINAITTNSTCIFTASK